MKKKQLLSLAALGAFVLGVIVWLFVSSVKFNNGELPAVSANGLKMMFGLETEYVFSTEVFGQTIQTTQQLVVTEFRFLGLVVLLVAVLALALGVLAYMGKVKSGIVAVAFVLVAGLMLWVGLTMESGYSEAMLKSIEELNAANVLLEKIGQDPVPLPYSWSLGAGTYLGMVFALLGAGVSVYSHLKVK